MAPPKGNQYYLLAKNFGRPKSYKPQGLWKKAVEYVDYCAKNPLKEEKVFGTGLRMTVSKMRAMTISGFCIFARITRETFNQYSKEDGYSDICSRIKEIFYMQKFEGAAAGLLNHALVIRELGLADKKVLEGPDGGPIKTEHREIAEIDYDKLTPDQLEQIYQARKPDDEE